jgi:hypothetical protein
VALGVEIGVLVLGTSLPDLFRNVSVCRIAALFSSIEVGIGWGSFMQQTNHDGFDFAL